MRSLLSICLLAICLTASAQVPGTAQWTAVFKKPVVPQQITVQSGSYLVNETFEADEFDLSWTEYGGGTINGNYTTVALDGAQSLYIAYADNETGVWLPFTAQDEVNGYFKFRWASFSSGRTVAALYNDTTLVALYSVTSTGPGQMRCNAGGTSSTYTTAGLASSTLGHIWIHYKKGTGANAQGDIQFSTDGIKPGVGNNYSGTTTGTATAQVNRIYLVVSGVGNAIFDTVKVSASSIGDNGQ